MNCPICDSQNLDKFQCNTHRVFLESCEHCFKNLTDAFTRVALSEFRLVQSEIELRNQLQTAEAALEKEEAAHEKTVDARDAAEDYGSRAYFLVTGNSPEWSNLFGYEQALGDITDALTLLKESLKTENVALKAERDEIANDYQRLGREREVEINALKAELAAARGVTK